MTYDSLDIIPLKLFLKILKTDNVTLLTDDRDRLEELTSIWARLKKEYQELDPNNNFDKTLRLMIKIEILMSKYNFLDFAVEYLKFERDLDLENKIRELKYRLNEETFEMDLNRVDRHRKAILIKVEQYNMKLPKIDGKKPTNIDEIILGYSSATSLNFDTNTITVTQFYGMIKVFDNKLKALEKQQSEIKNKSRR